MRNIFSVKNLLKSLFIPRRNWKMSLTTPKQMVKRKIYHQVWHILLFRTAAVSTQQNPCQCYYSKAECDAICCQVWLSGSAATRTNILVKDVQILDCFCRFKPCEHNSFCFWCNFALICIWKMFSLIRFEFFNYNSVIMIQWRLSLERNAVFILIDTWVYIKCTHFQH